MKRLITFLLLLTMAMLLGCGTNEPVIELAEPIDLATLPDLVDVNTVAALQGRSDVILIDVREQHEYDAGHIPDVTLIPLGDVPYRIDEIPTDKTIILTCRSGNRSGQAFEFLSDNGYENVHNMSGGFLAWEAAGLPVEQ